MPANFHESVKVEIAWTIVPFIIVIVMALPATKVVVAMKDTTNADITIKATGIPVEVGLRLPEGRGRGHRLRLRRWTPPHAHDVRLAASPTEADNYLLEGRQPAGGAGRQEGPHHHHRHRRDPRLDGAGLRRQAGRDPRLRARHLVQAPSRSATSTASAPSCAARSTPTCRSTSRWSAAEDYSASGSTARRRKSPPRPTIRARSGRWTTLQATRREGVRRQLRGLPPGQRQGRRPVPGAGRLADRERPHDHTKQLHLRAERQAAARCRPGSRCSRTPRSPPSSPIRRTPGPTRPARSCSRRKSLAERAK